jgi:holo-[acyl-carrier protein] synthase
MIFGIGTDVVQQERVRLVHEKFGDRFVERLLLPAELEAFRRYTRPVRFAAKEAIVKAMGTGFAHGMWIRDTGIVSNAWGKPEIIWSERGRHMCEKLGIGEGHVTLTDEAGLIVAVAVLMRKVTE